VHDVSNGYELIMNQNIDVVSAFKNNNKITDEMGLRGIPVVPEYC
jgi:hypothetical protein